VQDIDLETVRIQVFSPGLTGATFLKRYDWLLDGLFYPQAVTINQTGFIYVADYYGVHVYDLFGNFFFKFGSRGTSNGQFLSTIIFIALDSINGHIIVSDNGNTRVQIFDLNGIFLSTFGYYGNQDGNFSSNQGVATFNGNIYVCDWGNLRIQIFDATGNFLRKFDVSYFPSNIAIHPNGNIYIITPSNVSVQVYNQAGFFMFAIENLNSANSITISASGNVIISESNFLSANITVFDSNNGSFISFFNVTGVLNQAYGIATYNDQYLVAATYSLHSVVVIYYGQEMQITSSQSTITPITARNDITTTIIISSTVGGVSLISASAGIAVAFLYCRRSKKNKRTSIKELTPVEFNNNAKQQFKLYNPSSTQSSQ